MTSAREVHPTPVYTIYDTGYTSRVAKKYAEIPANYVSNECSDFEKSYEHACFAYDNIWGSGFYRFHDFEEATMNAIHSCINTVDNGGGYIVFSGNKSAQLLDPCDYCCSFGVNDCVMKYCEGVGILKIFIFDTESG